MLQIHLNIIYLSQNLDRVDVGNVNAVDFLLCISYY